MIFERIAAFFILIVLSPLVMVLTILGMIDTGSPLFSQKRFGKGKRIFTIYKFRTMKIGTKSMGSHEVNPNQVTQLGSFLRKTKLDEIPQIWNVINGDMSFVGPRPNLPNQITVIKERERMNVYSVKPGITGLAQINNIDMSKPKLLALYDSKMISAFSFSYYLKLIILTLIGKGQGDSVDK